MDSVKNPQAFYTFTNGGVLPSYESYGPTHLIYGDTDSVYLGLEAIFDRDARLEDVVAFADELGSMTNKDFRFFMKEVCNVDETRAQAIATDREVVSDKSLFLARKKYCMHVLNEEGINVDKLKTMGVELARTDTATCVKDILRDVVEMLMNGDPYTTVRAAIDRFKIAYHKMSMREIGRPTTIRGLEKYMDVVRANGDDINSISVGHVRAALYYNSLCGPNDEKIKAGDKVVVVYIADERFPSIALPVDVEVLPKFTDALRIDWTRQWQAVEKKMNIYLVPVGYDYATRQSTHLASLITF